VPARRRHAPRTPPARSTSTTACPRTAHRRNRLRRLPPVDPPEHGGTQLWMRDDGPAIPSA
jgi:hypothetical protein